MRDNHRDRSRNREKYIKKYGNKDMAGLTRKQRMTVRIRRRRPLSWQGGCAALVFLLFLMFLCTLFSGGSTTQAVTEDGGESGSDEGIVLGFLGDMMLGRYIMEYGEQYGYDSLFENMTAYWEDSDLVFANLESAVLFEDEDEYEQPEKEIYLYTTVTGLESALTAGINVYACANNHAFDYGEQAIVELCEYFQEEDVTYSGIGETLEETVVYQLMEVDGITVAFVSITEVYYSEAAVNYSQAGVLSTAYSSYNRIVNRASQEADVTVVYMHWGEENATAADSTQETLGHQLIDAGADIVIGCHPHVLQEVELYKNGIIFYSLGNFIFDQGNTWSRDSVMVEYTMDEDGTGEFVLYTLRLNDGIPSVTGNSFYQARINRELSQSLSDDTYSVNEDGYIVIPFDIEVES